MKDDSLLEIATAVAQGDQIDWDSEASQTSDDVRGLIDQLRVLDAVARMHRTQSLAADQSLPPAGPPAPLDPGAHWGRLVLIERVGGGTFGDVYRARDTTLDREVALKLLRRLAQAETFASQVLAEGRLLARVAHPNVITIYGAEAIDGRVGLWMEFINGLTLEEVLRQQRGPFSAREATFIGLDVCRALAAVHATGLVHRDVKASNVMREHGGRIVLMDFGTGADLGTADPAGRMAGTPLYLAPEIFEGLRATVQSDVYSLGVLLYHLTTSTYPLVGGSLAELAHAHRAGRFVRLRDARPNLADGFVRIVERALQPAPEQRFDSAGAMESALAGWLGIGAASAPRVDKGTGLGSVGTADQSISAGNAGDKRPVPISRWAVGAGVAVLLLVIALVVAVPRWRAKPTPPAAVDPNAPIRSLAVLPLQNLSGGDYFADGMTEALIGDLGRTGAIDVISRTSVMRFKGTDRSLPEIAKALNVDAVVEGSVLRDGGRVRITAQLIDARTDKHLWANSYERDVRDVLALQADVAQAIAKEIHLTLTRQQERHFTEGRTPVSPTALEAYLQGRFHWNRRGATSLRTAVDFFQQALKEDPKYASAFAGLADSYTVLGAVGTVMRPEVAMRQAKQAAQSAIAIDDTLGEAHTSLAMIHFWYDWDWAAAETEFKRAIALNRSYPTAHHWYAIYLSAMGRHDEALNEIEHATRLDPVSTIIRASRAWIRFQRRDYDGAIAESRQALELDPDFLRAHDYLGMTYLKQGMPVSAVRAFEQADRLGAGIPITRSQLASGYAAAGRTADAHKILTELLRPGAYSYVSPMDIAAVYVWLGERDRAIDWLEKAFQERSYALVYLKTHPGYDAMRQDPRFTALVHRLKFP